jgi:hypothetical protein
MNYDWLDLRQCAAAGNYNGAARAIDRLDERLRRQQLSPRAGITREMAQREGAILFAAEVLAAVPHGSLAIRISAGSRTLAPNRVLLEGRFQGLARADLMSLAGVLELERGDIAAAAARFAAARNLYAEQKEVADSPPGAAVASRYHGAILQYR